MSEYEFILNAIINMLKVINQIMIWIVLLFILWLVNTIVVLEVEKKLVDKIDKVERKIDGLAPSTPSK
jgi:hypothetical protein